MTDKEPIFFIEHILDSIQNVKLFMKDISRERFHQNEEKQSAVIRQIEIIGEAVKNLPEKLKNKYPSIEWSKVVRTKDKFIHHYFGINLDIVWDIVKKDLPDFKEQILGVKKKFGVRRKMIKKNTKAVFRENDEERTEDLIGGIPLSIGEIMSIHNNSEKIDWKVVDKTIDYFDKGEYQIVEVVYIFEKN